ncbi:MAG: hypothetical protein HRU41_10590 [Saprospiraceae bacterium]|nr:hypothetical protein [Saprospiraceae bacterium]
MPLRNEFPPAGSDYLGGASDGYEYRTTFAGMNLGHTYEMVKQFLKEEGYDDVPLPKNEEELLLFRLPTRNKQILLFEDNGYVHNPIKILFPIDRRKKKVLTLCIYNEDFPDHLLRFHRVLERKPSRSTPTEIETAASVKNAKKQHLEEV